MTGSPPPGRRHTGSELRTKKAAAPEGASNSGEEMEERELTDRRNSYGIDWFRMKHQRIRRISLTAAAARGRRSVSRRRGGRQRGAPALRFGPSTYLRGTFVMRALRSGSKLEAIAGVTGHTLTDLRTLGRHYIGWDQDTADAVVVAMHENKWRISSKPASKPLRIGAR